LKGYDENDLLLTFNELPGYKFETLKKFKEVNNRFPKITVDMVIYVIVYCLGD
jgi:hypothetical protein